MNPFHIYFGQNVFFKYFLTPNQKVVICCYYHILILYHTYDKHDKATKAFL